MMGKDNTNNEVNDIFLHGACDVFAQVLSDRTGWSICEFRLLDKKLVHAFCKSPNGKYYDVRGEFDTPADVASLYKENIPDWNGTVSLTEDVKYQFPLTPDIYVSELSQEIFNKAYKLADEFYDRYCDRDIEI